MISRIFCHQSKCSAARPSPCFDTMPHIVACVCSPHLTCKRGSVGQSEGLSISRSSVRFRLKPGTSNSHEFELHRPSNKGTKLLLKVIKSIIIISMSSPLHHFSYRRLSVLICLQAPVSFSSCFGTSFSAAPLHIASHRFDFRCFYHWKQ